MRAPTRIADAIEKGPPAVLWHACRPAQLQRYKATGGILPPVRGFDTPEGAHIWGATVGRSIVLEVDVELTQALPDHHHQMGLAWWSPKMGAVRWESVSAVAPDAHTMGLRALRMAKIKADTQ